VTDPDRRQTLVAQSPATRPTVESDSDTDPQTTGTTTTASTSDVLTQPLRVVVTCTGRTITGDSQPPTTTISYVPGRPRKKRKDVSTATKENTSPDKSLLRNFKKLQRRMARICKDQKKATTEMNKLWARLEKRLTERN